MRTKIAYGLIIFLAGFRASQGFTIPYKNFTFKPQDMMLVAYFAAVVVLVLLAEEIVNSPLIGKFKGLRKARLVRYGLDFGYTNDPSCKGRRIKQKVYGK